MRILNAKSEDFKTILNIVHSTIKDIYPKYYPNKVVNFFLDHHSEKKIIKSINKEKIFFLEVEGKIIGTGTLYKNEIKRMFILPEFQGNKYGSYLLNELEKIASANGYEKVTLSSSLPGYSLYQKRGYIPIKYITLKIKDGQMLC